MQRAIWISNFQKHKLPSWPCPTCGNATLDLDKKSLVDVESKISADAHMSDDWEPYWISGAFTARLSCLRTTCGERVVVSGEMKVLDQPTRYSAPDRKIPIEWHPLDIEVEQWIPEYTARYFYPPLRMIHVPDLCPKAINLEVQKAFELFWCDPNSSLNRMRVSLELVCDHFKVRRYIVGKQRKRLRMSLKDRIENLVSKSRFSRLKVYLHAIRWIGNSASHDKKATHEHALDGFELLEFVLTELFDGAAQRRTKLAAKIVSQKGIR